MSNRTSDMPDSGIPSGPIEEKWTKHKMDSRLINPANKRKYSIIVVGSGLAGGAAAATLSELGYKVKCFLLPGQPTARPQHRGARRNQCGEELPK